MKKTLLCWLLAVAAAAAEPQLYVRNQPFSAPVRWFPTRTLAPLDKLLEALGCHWQVDAAGVHIDCPHPGGEGGPALTEVRRLDLEGRPLRLEQHLQQDRIFVDVDQLAEALQCTYRRSSDGNTIDLAAPLLALGLGEGARRGTPDDADFPLVLEGLKLVPEAGSLKGFARVRNRGEQVYPRVLIRVAVYLKNGKLLSRFAETVTNLGPGETAAVQFPQVRCETVETPVARVEFEVR